MKNALTDSEVLSRAFPSRARNGHTPAQDWPLSVSMVLDGRIRLDAGALFGQAPWTAWSQLCSVDRQHRVHLDLYFSAVRTTGGITLLDAGLGDNVSELSEALYGRTVYKGRASMRELGFKSTQVTAVVLTSMATLSAGGLGKITTEGVLDARFPNARVYVQRAALEDFLASPAYSSPAYAGLPFDTFRRQLQPLDGASEVSPGIWALPAPGPLPGHQAVVVDTPKLKFIWPGAVIPTPWHLGGLVPNGHTAPRATLASRAQLLDRARRQGFELGLQMTASVSRMHLQPASPAGV